MKANYIRDYVRYHAHIGMPITTITDGEILVVLVSNLINQFSLGLKIVGRTSDGRNNLAIFKVILESTFDNTGVFYLGNPMFVMEGLAHVLANEYKAGLMYVKSDDDSIDTEVTKRNMQHCITWTKNHNRGKRLWRQFRIMWDFLVRGLLHLSKIVLPIYSTPYTFFLKIRAPSTTSISRWTIHLIE